MCFVSNTFYFDDICIRYFHVYLLTCRYVYNQIVSVLTQSQLNRVYDQRRNFDLRRLLSGSERLIDHLLNFMDREPAFFLGAIKCLPLLSSMRSSITQTIIQTCAKIKVQRIFLKYNMCYKISLMCKYYTLNIYLSEFSICNTSS